MSCQSDVEPGHVQGKYTQTVKCQTVYRHTCHTYLAYLQNIEIHYVHTYNKNDSVAHCHISWAAERQ